MSAALLCFAAAEILFAVARRGRRAPAKLALFAGSIANSAASLGVLAGVVLVFVGGWSLRTPWLLVSLGLIGALMVVRRTFVGPWETRVRSALQGEASSAQIKMLARESAALIGRSTVIALFVVVAALMVAKPALAFSP